MAAGAAMKPRRVQRKRSGEANKRTKATWVASSWNRRSQCWAFRAGGTRAQREAALDEVKEAAARSPSAALAGLATSRLPYGIGHKLELAAPMTKFALKRRINQWFRFG